MYVRDVVHLISINTRHVTGLEVHVLYPEIWATENRRKNRRKNAQSSEFIQVCPTSPTFYFEHLSKNLLSLTLLVYPVVHAFPCRSIASAGLLDLVNYLIGQELWDTLYLPITMDTIRA